MGGACVCACGIGSLITAALVLVLVLAIVLVVVLVLGALAVTLVATGGDGTTEATGGVLHLVTTNAAVATTTRLPAASKMRAVLLALLGAVSFVASFIVLIDGGIAIGG